MHHQEPVGSGYDSILPVMFADARRKWPSLTKEQFVAGGQRVVGRYLASETEAITVGEMTNAVTSELTARYGQPKNA